MNWQLKQFHELNQNELYALLHLRSEVFVIEQNCIYQDMDGVDTQCFHLFLSQSNQMVAYARLVPPGVLFPNASIGRVLVKSQYRGKNLGNELMAEAIKETIRLFKAKSITISAQCYLIKFYNRLGFCEIGEEYQEDGIPHIKMELKVALQ